MAGEGGGKPPAKKAAPRKRPAKKAPAKAAKRPAKKPTVTAEHRQAAAEAIASVTPIRGRKGRGSRTAGPGRRNATTPKDLLLFERRAHVVNLRRLGLPWEQVVKQVREHPRFGPGVPRYSKGDAHHDLTALLDNVTVEAALSQRIEDLALLAAMQGAVAAKSVAGDLRATDRLLAILDRRARWLGYDAPIKMQLTGADGGPIQIDTTDDAAVYAAALDALDEVLPHVQPQQLPAPPS